MSYRPVPPGIRAPRRPVKRRDVPPDPRDPERERPQEPEPLMTNRPAMRDCECCGFPFRPESPAVADATVCTWCAFHEREGL